MQSLHYAFICFATSWTWASWTQPSKVAYLLTIFVFSTSSFASFHFYFTKLFFVQLFYYFSTPDTRLVIIFVKVFIIFVGFILRRLTKTSLRKQPSIRHSLLLWISPIHFPSSLLIHVCIYQLLWNNEHVPWAAEQLLA